MYRLKILLVGGYLVDVESGQADMYLVKDNYRFSSATCN